MKPIDLIEIVVTHALDILFAGIPRDFPPVAPVQNCHIISHRGEYDNQTVFENSLPAFDAALKHGIWGVECDVRFIRDVFYQKNSSV